MEKRVQVADEAKELRTVAPPAVVLDTNTETSFDASSPLIQATDALLKALG